MRTLCEIFGVETTTIKDIDGLTILTHFSADAQKLAILFLGFGLVFSALFFGKL